MDEIGRAVEEISKENPVKYGSTSDAAAGHFSSSDRVPLMVAWGSNLPLPAREVGKFLSQPLHSQNVDSNRVVIRAPAKRPEAPRSTCVQRQLPIRHLRRRYENDSFSIADLTMKESR